MRKWKRLLLLIGGCFLLTGCTGRELEDRTFPSIITVPTENMEELDELRQRESVQYLDYSHTKAVLLKQEVAEDPEKLQKVLEYFRERPEFALNMLVFAGSQKELDLAKKEEKKIGNALQDFYKNQPKEEKETSVTLKDLLFFYDNGEEMQELPILTVSGKKLLPGGTLFLKPFQKME
jgi:hypothetical protein